MFSKLNILFLICSIPLAAYAVDIYKYKDENGDWVFGDKKPEVESEKLDVKINQKTDIEPELIPQIIDGVEVLSVKNPFYAPVEIIVQSRVFEKKGLRAVIEADTTAVIYDGEEDHSDAKLYWGFGDPAAVPDNEPYQIPTDHHAKLEVTQSFRGRFSHSAEPNVYAVDIAMDVGTYVTAAKAGTVFYVKDDYYQSGQKEYFADKANVVMILHEDGTYASYAHLLGGTALVKPGDVVAAGTRVGRSGSSGYSTGPHLHFVIRRNAGLRAVSVPFEFIDKSGQRFIPKTRMFVGGK